MQKLINLYRKISNKSYSTLAGSIAFFLIINGGSVFFLIINICNNLGYDVFNYVDTSFLPVQLSTMLDIMYYETLTNNHSIFYSITSIISGSTFFYHLIKVTEMIYDSKFTKKNLINRIISILLVIIFLVVLVIIFILFLILNLFTKGMILNIVLKYLMMLFIPFLIILFINRVVIPVKNEIKEIISGVIISTISWFIATIGFSIFLNIFLNYKNSYGTLSFFIVFMIWIYLLSQGLIIGIILNYNIGLKKINKDKILLAHRK